MMYPGAIPAIRIPPIPPANPASPVAEPTAREGKQSVTSVNMFADQPLWAEHARLTNRIATQGLEAFTASAEAGRQIAQTNITVFLAFLTCQPLLIKKPGAQPYAVAEFF